MESRKDDYKDDKVRMDLLPWPELEEVAKVYTAGRGRTSPTPTSATRELSFVTYARSRRVTRLTRKPGAII